MTRNKMTDPKLEISKSLLEIAKLPVLDSKSLKAAATRDDLIKIAKSMILPISRRRWDFGPRTVDLPSTGW
jgi:hypothetical protein